MALRLFFGLPIPAATDAALRAVCAGFHGDRNQRWIDPAQWHLTLVFLGAAQPEQLDDLYLLGQRAAEAAPADVARLTGLGWLPSARRPRLLAALARDRTPFATLHRMLCSGANQLGFAMETRPLLPHVTLMRLARNSAVESNAALPRLDIALPIAELVLYSSEAGPSGPRYRRLWARALAT